MSQPKWVNNPPSLFDIVSGYYPETKPKADGPSLRPCLVTKVLKNDKTGGYACEIAYGTKTLKASMRQDKDIIIQNSGHLDAMGLAVATRFALDDNLRIIMPWTLKYFGCWANKNSPKLGELMLTYQKDYAWIMMKRLAH